MTENRLIFPIEVRGYEKEIVTIQDWCEFVTYFEKLLRAARAVTECAFVVDPATVPDGGIGDAPSRVIGEIRISLLQRQDLLNAISLKGEPTQYDEFGV